MKKSICCFIFLFLFSTTKLFSQISYPGLQIFEPGPEHGHTHASGIVELPNGDLMACWYEGVSDRSRDVHIQAARLPKGAKKWEPDFLLADTPMLSDNNPCLFVDDQQRLWLFYYTLLGSPEEAWDTALLRYKISSDYTDPAKPIVWEVQNDLPIIPSNLDETVAKLCADTKLQQQASWLKEMCPLAQEMLKHQLVRRLGWTTRARPLTLANGTILLPMASETFGVAMMALTADGGQTWEFSEIPYGLGVEQPSVFQRSDGTLVALMRDASDANRIRVTESTDSGFHWSPIQNLALPNPGSGLEVVRLQSGRVALIYNDCEDDPRNSLAVSLSEDEGKTWKWTRHLERGEKNGRFDYPSMFQARDGKIHASYSFNLKTIKHVVFDEKWLME